jgi:hypothetical protein
MLCLSQPFKEILFEEYLPFGVKKDTQQNIMTKMCVSAMPSTCLAEI